MTDPKEAKRQAKAAKKAAKAEYKRRKKLGRLEPAQSSPPSSSSGRTPAERAAEAAEKQVALHRYRVFLALITALVTLATFLLTVGRSYLKKDAVGIERVEPPDKPPGNGP
ncbi:MAG: hypothetical protein D6788_07695 [Planctomycetota bacterium]|nr:MAG: hypothetical protein D6788_07695 [Planctomycetota bacterium]